MIKKYVYLTVIKIQTAERGYCLLLSLFKSLLVNDFKLRILNNYSPKGKWTVGLSHTICYKITVTVT